MSKQKDLLISDLIEELKRLQIEYGNLPCVRDDTDLPPGEGGNYPPAWPSFAGKRIEF